MLDQPMVERHMPLPICHSNHCYLIGCSIASCIFLMYAVIHLPYPPPYHNFSAQSYVSPLTASPFSLSPTPPNPSLLYIPCPCPSCSTCACRIIASHLVLFTRTVSVPIHRFLVPLAFQIPLQFIPSLVIPPSPLFLPPPNVNHVQNDLITT